MANHKKTGESAKLDQEGEKMSGKSGTDGKTVVELASFDYLVAMTVENYLLRVRNYKQLNQAARLAISRLRDLQVADKLENPDADTRAEVTELMAITFRLRHHDVFHKSLSVRNCMEIFPGLKLYDEIRWEFERIRNKDVNEFERHLNCVLKEYAKEQCKQKSYTCTNNHCKEALQIIRENGENEARKTAARIMIYACAQSQRKWSDVIYKVYESPVTWLKTNRPHPTVVVTDSPFNENCADLYCEDTLVLSKVHFFQAILACYFFYYIFNIDYPDIDAETFQPFDNVMSLMDSTPRIKRVKRNHER